MVPIEGSTSGGFSRSSTAICAATRGSSSAASNGRLIAQVGRPRVSVMITGTPRSRIVFARSRSAAFAASGLGSARALRIWACMRLDREASRRSSTTTRCEYTMYEPSTSARRRPRRTTGAPRRMSRSGENVYAEIRTKCFGNGDGAIGSLVMLEQRRDGAWKRKPGSVQRVHEARLFAAPTPKPNAAAAGLEIGKGAARRHLEPRANARRPHLEIVRLRAGKARVAGGENLHAIRQLEKLEDSFRVCGEQLVLAGRVLRRRQANELHLVELVDAQQATRVLPVRSRLAAKTWRVAHVGLRQLGRVEHLIAVQARDRHFRGRDEKEVIVFDDVHVVLELRQLSRRRRGGAIDEKGD